MELDNFRIYFNEASLRLYQSDKEQGGIVSREP